MVMRTVAEDFNTRLYLMGLSMCIYQEGVVLEGLKTSDYHIFIYLYPVCERRIT
jgi:hypothetical protein